MAAPILIVPKGSDVMKKGVLPRLIFMFFTCVVFTACNPIEYKDISSEERFKNILGIEFQLLLPAIATGITVDPNYKPVVDSVFLVPKPGFSGPEVVFRKELPKGVKIKVVGVFSEGGVIFNQMFYRVDIVDIDDYKTLPVYIYITGDINDPNRGVDDMVFKLKAD